MAGKSMGLSDYTNTILARSSFGLDTSSSVGCWSIENETLLSEDSDISLKRVVGAKSFIKKVVQSFNATELSTDFPTGSLNDEKLKKKKRASRASQLDSIKSLTNSSSGVTEALKSPLKHWKKRKCNIDLSSSKCNSDSFTDGLDSISANKKSNTLNKSSVTKNFKRKISVQIKNDSTSLTNYTEAKDTGSEVSNDLEKQSNVSNLEGMQIPKKNSEIHTENFGNDLELNKDNLTNSRRSSTRLRLTKQSTMNNSKILNNQNLINFNECSRNSTGEEKPFQEDLSINDQNISLNKEGEYNGSNIEGSDKNIESNETKKANLSQKQFTRKSILNNSHHSVCDSLTEINLGDASQNLVSDRNSKDLKENSTYTSELHNSVIKYGSVSEDPVLLDSINHHSIHLDKSSNEKYSLSHQTVSNPILSLPMFHKEIDTIGSNSVIKNSEVEEIDKSNKIINDEDNMNFIKTSVSKNIENEKISPCLIESTADNELSKSVVNKTELETCAIEIQNKSSCNSINSTSHATNENISKKKNSYEISNTSTSTNIEQIKNIDKNTSLRSSHEISFCSNQAKTSDVFPSKKTPSPKRILRKSLSKSIKSNNFEMVTDSESNVINEAIPVENNEINNIGENLNSESRDYNEKIHNIKVRRCLRRSVTFANTARFKSDSQSGEISISLSPTAKESDNACPLPKIISTEEPQRAASDSEHLVALVRNNLNKENIEPCQQREQTSSEMEKEIIKHKDKTVCNEENNDNFIYPEKPLDNEKRIGELNETNRKRKCMEERTPLKRKRLSEKTINELSYDTYSDVSEIPLDKTIIQKKLIYHSTPKYSVLDNNLSSNQSSRRSCRLKKNCKDQVIQVSKSIFGTSSEVTSGRKTSKELSTSYSFQQKVIKPKRKSSTPKNYNEKIIGQSSSSCQSPSSSLLPTSENYYSSSDGNKASYEDSSVNKFIPSVISTLTHSKESSIQYRAKKNVCFKDYSSHIEYTKEKSTRGSSGSRNSQSDFPTMTSKSSIGKENSANDTSIAQDPHEPSGSFSRRQSSEHTFQNSQVPVDTVPSKIISELSIATSNLKSVLIYESQPKKSIKNNKVDETQVFIPQTHCLKQRYDYENDERFMICYKSYKPPTTKFPDKWVHPDLLKFICSKLNENYDPLEAKVISQKIIIHLCATVSGADKLENPEDIEASALILKNLISKYQICVNAMEYCMFIYRFTPFKFQRKMLSQKGKLCLSKVDSPIIVPSEKIEIR